MLIPYRPEEFTNFRDPDTERSFQTSLAEAERSLGREYPLLIDGKAIMTEGRIISRNPSRKEEMIGSVAKATKEHAELAMQSAHRTLQSWARTPAHHRARILLKAAAILRRRKHEFSAWLLLEAGKTRSEADADSAEAIDFMEYYARQMMEMEETSSRKLIPMPGENTDLRYIPLGVGVVIPPWNFPLAIMVGMTTAAIVAGNTVVLKPASTTPVIAYKFLEILLDAGLPPGVVQYVPGSGSEIGNDLISHKLTRFIAFTGSREVGLGIFELSAKTSSGQLWLKRFIGELGGKDSIVVDDDADLEEAARGITASAFGFSGQKCSACSRAIIHERVYDQVLQRVTELTGQLKLGDVREPQFDMGPVIDEHAYNRILAYIETGKKEARLVFGGQPGPENGYYIEPTIFADAAPDAVIMQEEIFGPVLAFTKARDFDQALDIANNTEYGLTGSVYTRSREKLERARSEFHVGNLYLNRKCTGAIVGVHPFGGFHMSGTDSKAGGPDYLLQFTQPKLISEKL